MLKKKMQKLINTYYHLLMYLFTDIIIYIPDYASQLYYEYKNSGLEFQYTEAKVGHVGFRAAKPE